MLAVDHRNGSSRRTGTDVVKGPVVVDTGEVPVIWESPGTP